MSLKEHYVYFGVVENRFLAGGSLLIGMGLRKVYPSILSPHWATVQPPHLGKLILLSYYRKNLGDFDRIEVQPACPTIIFAWKTFDKIKVQPA